MYARWSNMMYPMALIPVKLTWKSGYCSVFLAAVSTTHAIQIAESVLMELIGSIKPSKTSTKDSRWPTIMQWQTTRLRTLLIACVELLNAGEKLKVSKIFLRKERKSIKGFLLHICKNWSRSSLQNEKKNLYINSFFSIEKTYFWCKHYFIV